MATKTANTNGSTARSEMQAKRLSDLEQETKAQAALIKQHSRQIELMKKEKDNMHADYNKTVLVK